MAGVGRCPHRCLPRPAGQSAVLWLWLLLVQVLGARSPPCAASRGSLRSPPRWVVLGDCRGSSGRGTRSSRLARAAFWTPRCRRPPSEQQLCRALHSVAVWGGGEWPQRLAPCPGVLGALCRAQLLQLVLTASSVPEGVPRVGPDPWPRGAHSCPSPWPAWWPPGLCQGPIARSHRAGFVSPESRGSCRLSVLPLETNLARLPRTPVSTQWATSVCVCVGGGVT